MPLALPTPPLLLAAAPALASVPKPLAKSEAKAPPAGPARASCGVSVVEREGGLVGFWDGEGVPEGPRGPGAVQRRD